MTNKQSVVLLRQALTDLLDACVEMVPDRLGPGYDMEYLRRPDWTSVENARKALQTTDSAAGAAVAGRERDDGTEQ